MNHAHFREVTFATDAGQLVGFDVEQMFVGGYQQGNSRQSGFGQNQPIVQLRFGQQPQFVQAAGELFGDAVSDRGQIEGNDAPTAQVPDGGECQLRLLAGLVQGGERQFLDDCGRELQGEAFFVGDFQKGKRKSFFSARSNSRLLSAANSFF